MLVSVFLSVCDTFGNTLAQSLFSPLLIPLQLPMLLFPHVQLWSKDVSYPNSPSQVAHFDLTTVCLSAPLVISSKTAN